jgi:UDPglucose 6-dehydrogenase
LFDHLNSPIIVCDLESAELIKYASNSFLATKISFINEISQICDLSGADVSKVSLGMGLDSRIGPKFLNASIGYGGSCFPKDVKALYKTSKDLGYEFKILESVMEVNSTQKFFFLEKIKKIYGSDLKGKKVGVLGLAFKNDTDDIRESVAIEIVKILQGMGGALKVYDPQAIKNSRSTLGDKHITYTESSDEVFDDIDFLVILTEWSEFKDIKDDSLLKLRDKRVFDGRNLLDKKHLNKLGLEYYCIGKK